MGNGRELFAIPAIAVLSHVLLLTVTADARTILRRPEAMDEFLHEEPRCRHCSPLLDEPWAHSAGRETPENCPVDAWNHEGNQWKWCGLVGDWKYALQHARSFNPKHNCSVAKSVRAMSWCWQPAFPGCVTDVLSKLRTSNVTVAFVGDSLTAQTFNAVKFLINSIIPTTDCTAEFMMKTVANILCFRLPSGTSILMVIAGSEFTQKKGGVWKPITEEEAALCRERAGDWYPAVPYPHGIRHSSALGPGDCRFNSWISVLPLLDVAVINYGLWGKITGMEDYGEYRQMVDNTLAAVKKHFKGRKVVFRSTTLGHYEVQGLPPEIPPREFTHPLRERRTGVARGKSDYYMYFKMIEYERAWVGLAKKHKVPLQFLNITGMMSQRIDGHVDNIHYCPLSAMWWVSRIALQAVFS